MVRRAILFEISQIIVQISSIPLSELIFMRFWKIK